MNEIKLEVTLVFSGPIELSSHAEVAQNVREALEKYYQEVGLAPSHSSVLTEKIYVVGPNNYQIMTVL